MDLPLYTWKFIHSLPRPLVILYRQKSSLLPAATWIAFIAAHPCTDLLQTGKQINS
jgi:hypothetical protein